MANHFSHACLPYPIRGAKYSIAFDFPNPDGVDPTGNFDTEVSKDGGAFADATEEVTVLSGSNTSGSGWITFTASEMTCVLFVALLNSQIAGQPASQIRLKPRKLPVMAQGTASAGGASTITLAASASGYEGCIVLTTGGTGVGQAREIVSVSGNQVTVSDAWETNPDATTTYQILRTELTSGGGGSTDVNIVSISGDTAAADALEAMLDGTGGTTLTLAAINVTNNAGNAVTLTSNGGNGHGLRLVGNGSGEGLSAVGGATGNGAEFTAGGGNTDGIRSTGSGTGDGMHLAAGASGDGLHCVGGATAGHGIVATATGDGDGILAIGVASHGIEVIGGGNNDALHLEGSGTGKGLYVKGGTNGDGIYAEGGATAGAGMKLVSATEAELDAENIVTLLQDIPTVAEFNARTIVSANYALEATLTAIKGATFNGTTDSLEAIRDRGDAAWVTATGFSTLTQADVRTAVGLASANLDTQLNALGTLLLDIPTVAEFNARTLASAAYATAAVQTSQGGTLSGIVNETDKIAAMEDQLNDLWRYGFKKKTMNSTQIVMYQDDGITTYKTMAISDVGGVQTVQAAV